MRHWRIDVGGEESWAIEDGDGLRVVDALGKPRHVHVEDGSRAETRLQATFGPGAVVEPHLPVGCHFPRMWRPRWSPSPQRYATLPWTDAVHAASTILLRLQDVVRFIEPSEENRRAYGHELRNLLILAATEVESAWKGVLRANGYSGDEKSWTTNDYVKLCEPMRLDRWEIVLSDYPRFQPLRPFAGWVPDRPTQSLPWYQKYNATKHDRESCLCLADFQSVLLSCGAMYVMVLAQFGTFSGRGDHTVDLCVLQVVNAQEVATNRVFRLTASGQPVWDLNDLYTPPGILGHQDWTPLEYFAPRPDG